MTETLASLIDRVEVFLADSNNKSWSTDTITECIRLALAEINRAAGATYSIKDLDSASTTTLSVADIPVLVVGTAAYCAKNRALDRMEKPGLGEGPEAGLNNWGDWARKQFDEALTKIRAKGLNGSETAPHSEITWDEDPHKW